MTEKKIEYQLLLQFADDLTQLIQHNVVSVSSKLFATGLVAKDVHDSVLIYLLPSYAFAELVLLFPQHIIMYFITPVRLHGAQGSGSGQRSPSAQLIQIVPPKSSFLFIFASIFSRIDCSCSAFLSNWANISFT